MNGLMIVGTDTGVGKTTLCELLLSDAVARRANVGIYKPVCTGSECGTRGNNKWSDIERLHQASGERFGRDDICPQRFHAPLAPPIAAELEGRHIDEELLSAGLERWRTVVDTLIIEGVGGLLCPISERLTIADLAKLWRVPIVVVAANRLGAINHTLLTLEVAERRGLTVAGWVLNHVEPDGAELAETNVQAIRARTGIVLQAEIPFWGTGELQSSVTSSRMLMGREVQTLADILSLSGAI